MGDFAEACNAMVEQLDQRRAALLEEIEAGHRKTQALMSSNDLFEAITTNIAQGIVVINNDTGELLFVNNPMKHLLHETLLKSQLPKWLMGCIAAGETRKEFCCADLGLQHEDTRCFSVSLHPLYWRGRNSTAFVLTDISAEKAHLRSLEDLAYLDPVTKIYNRQYGMMMMNAWLDENRAFMLCFVDMDNLKFVNDKFGHAEGDAYITRTVNVLCDFSPEALVCRLGGDEFMLLAEGWSMSDAEERMEQLRNRLVLHSEETGAAYNHSMSYGVIAVDEDSTYLASDLLAIADKKMYAYKVAHKAQRKSIV